MRRTETLWADAWFEEDKDIVKVKVSLRFAEDGVRYKKGVTFRITEEMLRYLAEGQEYPIKRIGLDMVESVTKEEDSD